MTEKLLTGTQHKQKLARTIMEPQHDKASKMTHAPSEDSAQPEYPPKCPSLSHDQILGSWLPIERAVKIGKTVQKQTDLSLHWSQMSFYVFCRPASLLFIAQRIVLNAMTSFKCYKVNHTSHVMRKPVFAICEQQKRRSACVSAQSDQRLCCSLPR